MLITLSLKIRNLSNTLEPWLGDDYENAYSTMMVPKTTVSAISTRIIKLDKNGHTETHSHPRVHHVIGLSGHPILETPSGQVALDHLTAVEIPSDIPHRFMNNSEAPATILVINLFK
jgi:quercetin dioxygenase-like cupin family protein